MTISMNLYQDRSLFVDEDGITVTSYYWPGHHRFIPFSSITAFEVISVGSFSGRFRLVGFEFRHLRNFFHWDTQRSTKSHAIALDIGRRVRPVISPSDFEQVLQLITDHANNGGATASADDVEISIEGP